MSKPSDPRTTESYDGALQSVARSGGKGTLKGDGISGRLFGTPVGTSAFRVRVSGFKS